ncbi:hypothetical protein F4820DRAFT_441399 [Hypoxylon rubiginosum]|uniref:Uncharacterized protein n=1 Tax=Hypoxylon rubiginosum TaxID=110542 RepID=A0ACB9YHT9_9PEZI|nr:hypothetical protein F4820DRAFT_441399 [Hypoxylon rubiginosum]
MRKAGEQTPSASHPAPTLSGLTKKEIEAIRTIVLRGQMLNESTAVQERILDALQEATIPASWNVNLPDAEIEARVNSLIHDLVRPPQPQPPGTPTLVDTHSILGASDADGIRNLARDQNDADSIVNFLQKYPQSRILFPKTAQYNAEMAVIHGMIHDIERPVPRVINTPAIEDTHVILEASDTQGIKAMVGDQAETDRIVTLLQRHPGSMIAFLKSSQDQLREDEIQRRIHALIHDLIKPPPQAPVEHPPVQLPSDLTPAEIQAMRWLIPDLITDRAYGRKLAEALDAAAKRLPAKPSKHPFASKEVVFSGSFKKPSTATQGNIVQWPAQGPTQGPTQGTTQGTAQGTALGPLGSRRRIGADVPFVPYIPPPVPVRRQSGSSSWWSKAIVFFAILALAWGLLSALSGQGQSDVDDIFPQEGVHWPSWSGITGSLGRVVPSRMPKLWPDASSRSPSDKPSAKPSSKGFDTVKPDNMKTDSALGELIEDISKRVPSEVFVDRGKNGRIRISEDFWHALRALIKNDDVILTLKNARIAPEISEDHWRAVKARIEHDSSLLPASSEDGAPGGASWDSWVKQNRDKVKDWLGNEKPKDKTGLAISREEFLKVFREEIHSYQRDIRKEFATRDSQIQKIRDTVERLRETAKSSGAMTEKQIRAICDQIVSRAIQKTKLDALAEGRIKGGARQMFDNQVNFFTVFSGAIIDPHASSKAWRPTKSLYPYGSKEWFMRDGYRPQAQNSVLTPWFEEGECFCTGPSTKGVVVDTNTISVLISRPLVPQHLVVEHVTPASSLDPGSRPKDIEVWMYVEELTLRKEVEAFSLKHIPPTPEEKEKKLKKLNEAFVKVGHFTYEDLTHGDGTQIFKLSDELSTMGAWSQNFVVRAISNYGADHTCFYRLKMYGDIVEGRRWRVEVEEK